MTRVVVFRTYGGPAVLQDENCDPPEPDAGEVRVAVKAAGVQPFDCLFRSGAAKAWVPARFPQRLGNEFAGVIDAAGSDVPGLSIGDEVLGWAMLACYAEHVVVADDQVVSKPQSTATVDRVRPVHDKE